MLVSEKIKYFRRSLGWSQRELAQKLCINHSYVSRIESGINAPSLSLMVRLSQAFNVSFEELTKDILLFRFCEAARFIEKFGSISNLSKEDQEYVAGIVRQLSEKPRVA